MGKKKKRKTNQQCQKNNLADPWIMYNTISNQVLQCKAPESGPREAIVFSPPGVDTFSQFQHLQGDKGGHYILKTQ